MTEQHVESGFRLGKQAHREDERTAMLGDFLATPPTGIPSVWDFERGRKPFPTHMWGNDSWGDCVIAARANQQQRDQRIETRQTIPMTDEMAVAKYKELTGAASPGDQNDTGLVILDALSDWRHGWHLPVWDSKGRTYSIDAYGLLRHGDAAEMRAGCYLLTGVQFGLNLPLTAADQIRKGLAWDVADGPRAEPGSWGGHCVYSCSYDTGGWYVWTWARKQYMTDKFVDTYADESWGVVQSNETHSRYVDTTKLAQYLRDIGASHIG